MKRMWAIWLSIMLALGSAFLILDVSEETEGKVVVQEGVGYVPHAPFRINSNAEFDAMALAEGWQGNGSYDNPYIIENYDIDGTGYSYCLYVGNTTHNYTIMDCNLHDANGVLDWPYFPQSALCLYNTRYGLLENNTLLMNNQAGIYLNNAIIAKVMNNNASQNAVGIMLRYSGVVTMEDNTLSSHGNSGINLWQSHGNHIINNTISNSTPAGGIVLYDTQHNTVHSNTLTDDGIYVMGNSVSYWNTHTISTSNEVNGRPVQYWKNQIGGKIPPGAGQVILANCTGVTVENQILNNTHRGILVGYSTNLNINNNSAYSVDAGIVTAYSSDNWIDNNTVEYSGYGFGLHQSTGNTVTNNTISNNVRGGISINSGSDGNLICRNNITNHRQLSDGQYAMYVWNSNNNLIYHNNFINNTRRVYDNNPIEFNRNYYINGYPSGGNYWDGALKTDLYYGANQDLLGSDGIQDTPYTNIHGSNNIDEYPLQAPFNYTEYEVPLQQGWNLICLPTRQLNWSIDSVLESIDVKWNGLRTYDVIDSTWHSNIIYRPGVLNDLNELNHLHGYWINITEPGVTLTVKGDIFNSSLSLPLYAGWNLVGYSSLTEKSISDALAGTGYDRPVEGFDGGAPYHISQLPDAYMMKPGESYWVHVPADTIWVVDW